MRNGRHERHRTRRIAADGAVMVVHRVERGGGHGGDTALGTVRLDLSGWAPRSSCIAA